ncbi:hypothetical protein [Gillisia sp. JM1]|uniref:hypothetical protein n=1 Tax=Gillisia sp. JM1 TaxID=1283286 RepID=UPI0004194350|nr:hypothetical protein [Gillisia sp. JM1]
MISKYSDSNKFGGETWRIKIHSLFHIFINDTKDNSYLVEIKEWRFFNYKVRESFISRKDFEKTVYFAFDKMQEYLNNTKKYYWTNQQKQGKLNIIADFVQDYNKSSSNKSKNAIRGEFKILLQEFENSDEAQIIQETEDFAQFYWEFPESNTKSTYAVRRIRNNKVRVEWTQDGRLGKLENEWEFDIKSDQSDIKYKVNQGMKEITQNATRKQLDDLLNGFNSID